MAATMPRMGATVWLAPKSDDADPEEHHVEIRHVDRLTAEKALHSLGLNDPDLAQTLTTAWGWAALKRAGTYGGELARFLKVDVYEFSMDDDDADGEGPTVDPTRTDPPADSASP